jgi:hypothetical protein
MEWGLFFQACVDFLGWQFVPVPATARWTPHDEGRILITLRPTEGPLERVGHRCAQQVASAGDPVSSTH